MNAPLTALPISLQVPGSYKKRRVLLVDTSHAKRDMRAEVMRKLGMDVDCAADIAEARSWWRADLYDLVLINMEKGRGHRDRFCDDMRTATPPQRLAFLVGKPGYLADFPQADEEIMIGNGIDKIEVSDVKAAMSANIGDLSQRWGILEASRRISAVRSASTARSRAMRDRPVPPRDPEGRASKKTAESVTTLDDLLREELHEEPLRG
jgi:CheY-like chemotaxis protein